MTEKKEHATEPVRRRGRPRVPSMIARPNRIVTFVTDHELEFLKQKVIEAESASTLMVLQLVTHSIGRVRTKMEIEK